ncbi:exodeoxyribonuclease I [Candidatus Saccharibacteria bacterium]|nr:MAG: exodeoxyribonuclease I [Candidatus Saccharibacteria bacterium]
MAGTFFFYDLETSGLSARDDRIMQFAGQRTSMDLQSIGDPVNVMVRLSDDSLPSPEALLVTGITPQQTLADGYSEAEFARMFTDEIAIPNTIMVGYNSVRFDDEFMRHTLWRNFYDPYEWSWAEGRSRWDLLDVVRLFRALRPSGIEWPVDSEGRSVNRLELLSKVNNLEHTHAHDALSDVEALIGVAKLLKSNQPKMFDYLLAMRDKKAVAELVNLENPEPFIYASGRYDGKYEKTTVAFPIAPGKKPGSVLVYNLRFSPNDYVDLSAEDIIKRLSASYEERRADDFVPIPVKELMYNRCPAVAKISALDQSSQQRLDLDVETITKHRDQLLGHRDLVDKIAAAWQNRPDFPKNADVEGQLYDSFTPDVDKPKINAIRNATAETLADFHPNFVDDRLSELLFRYKARQFPSSLSADERMAWEQFKAEKFQRELPDYMARLAKIAADTTDSNKQFVLEELQLWVESIMPVDL